MADPSTSGMLALIGSGEYLPEMAEFESSLLRGPSRRYVQIPTASTLESRERVEYWVRLGEAQAARIGAEAVPLVVANRQDADDAAIVGEIKGAGLIYFSGGNPNHLASTLIGTKLLDAVRDEWRAGASVAGCSAGAMALGSVVAGFRAIPPKNHPAFGFADVVVLPHFDRMIGRLPGLLRSGLATTLRDGLPLFGIDELTAVTLDPILDPTTWRVSGRGTTWVSASGVDERFSDGEEFMLDELISRANER